MQHKSDFAISGTSGTVRGVGFSHGLWPWKYLREGGAITSEKSVNEN
jgi:hypothetical protein